MPLILNPDHTFDTYYFRTDSVQIMGEWRIFGDTLLLYQMEQLWADSIFRQDNINRSEHHYNDMRSTMSGFNQRLVSDTSYCLNVAAFQFEGDGSSFTGIQDRYPIVGFTVSKKEASRNHPAPYLNETINWRDTLTWKPHCWNQEENMVGLIKSIDRIDNQTVRMRVEVDGLVFTIINPLFFIRSNELVEDKHMIADWFSKFKEEDSIIIRELYQLDAQNGQTRVSSDTIYVMDSDVKGYWIATPKKRAK